SINFYFLDASLKFGDFRETRIKLTLFMLICPYKIGIYFIGRNGFVCWKLGLSAQSYKKLVVSPNSAGG
ncbi:MAG: hypothetical protein K2M40_08330, partial [Muribaculaceae bacterium]|nr:hypothetical protein [Muribaculaceae bacterium]